MMIPWLLELSLVVAVGLCDGGVRGSSAAVLPVSSHLNSIVLLIEFMPCLSVVVEFMRDCMSFPSRTPSGIMCEVRIVASPMPLEPRRSYYYDMCRVE